MKATLFTFDTTHHALWAEEIAIASGIAAEVIPAPPAARARCNLALAALPEDGARLAEALQREGIPHAVHTDDGRTGDAGPGRIDRPDM